MVRHRIYHTLWLSICLAALLPLTPVHARETGREVRTSTAQMAARSTSGVLFSDGFESGDLHKWSGKAGLVAQQRSVHTGDYAARAIGDGTPAFARKTLAAPQSDVFYRARFMLVSQGDNPINLVGLRTATEGAGAPLVRLFVTPTGHLTLHNLVTGSTRESGTQVAPGAWHELQLHVRIGEPTGRIEVWLDNVPINALSSDDALGAAAIGRIDIGEDEAGRVFDVAFDDVIAAATLIQPSQPTEPVVIQIETVPPLPHVRFTLDQSVATSDSQGIARFEVETIKDLSKRLKLEPSQIADDTRAALGRWFWDRNTRIRAALDLSHPVTFSFANLQEQPVAAETISALTLKSSTGEVHTVTTPQLDEPLWLHASRIVPTHNGLLQKDLYYSVESVMIRGSNVVNRAQQRFVVRTQRHWPIALMFYSARFSSHDALFGVPIGGGIEVEYPDGSTETRAFDAANTVTFDHLPRGEYRIRVQASGISPFRPLALTRNQVVDLEVFSETDIAVVGISLASLAIGLLLIGRPHLLLVLIGRARERRKVIPTRTGGRPLRRAWRSVLPLSATLVVSGVCGITLLRLERLATIDMANHNIQPGGTTIIQPADETPGFDQELEPAPAGEPPGDVAGTRRDEGSEDPGTSAARSASFIYTVRDGDSLLQLAQQFYGSRDAWRRIFDANRDRIRDPNQISPGQQIEIPQR